MSEMVQRAAKAILAKVPVGYGMTKDEALEYARAAIEAMREPTEAMTRSQIAIFTWKEMIDECLK